MSSSLLLATNEFSICTITTTVMICSSAEYVKMGFDIL